jgi:hypothetical protein
MRQYLRHMSRLAPSAALAAALCLSGCATDLATSNSSDVLLEMTRVQGQGTGLVTTISDFLLSDVLFKGSTFNDNAILSLTALPKNPSAILNSGNFNTVYLESYEVHYIRTDGLNQEGVDVPFSFSGGMGATIPVAVGTTTQVGIIVVRHQAKQEPPLSNLDGGGGLNILTCIAQITVHGHTLSGEAVQASGNLNVTFADFADTTT